MTARKGKPEQTAQMGQAKWDRKMMAWSAKKEFQDMTSGIAE
jgi:hypothetical protein